MEVWYCEPHEQLGDERNCWVARRPMQASVPFCRMVPMRLVPDDAFNRFEVIDHTDNGQGRILSKWETFNFQVDFDVQDGGRTLKVFLISESR